MQQQRHAAFSLKQLNLPSGLYTNMVKFAENSAPLHSYNAFLFTLFMQYCEALIIRLPHDLEKICPSNGGSCIINLKYRVKLENKFVNSWSH